MFIQEARQLIHAKATSTEIQEILSKMICRHCFLHPKQELK